MLAHRLAYYMAYGELPEGKVVMHRCDNPPCVRITHLRLGTQAENVADRDAKGRTARGDAIRIAKLTEAQVLDIRSRYASGGVTYMELADEYDVALNTIASVVRGQTYRHLPNVCGKSNRRRKLSDEQVAQIRALRAEGKSLKELADTYGVQYQYISKICLGLAR